MPGVNMLEARGLRTEKYQLGSPEDLNKRHTAHTRNNTDIGQLLSLRPGARIAIILLGELDELGLVSLLLRRWLIVRTFL